MLDTAGLVSFPDRHMRAGLGTRLTYLALGSHLVHTEALWACDVCYIDGVLFSEMEISQRKGVS